MFDIAIDAPLLLLLTDIVNQPRHRSRSELLRRVNEWELERELAHHNPTTTNVVTRSGRAEEKVWLPICLQSINRL